MFIYLLYFCTLYFLARNWITAKMKSNIKKQKT